MSGFFGYTNKKFKSQVRKLYLAERLIEISQERNRKNVEKRF